MNSKYIISQIYVLLSLSFCLLAKSTELYQIENFSGKFETLNNDCISVYFDGEVSVKQNFGIYTRTATFVMVNGERGIFVGHELCVGSNVLTKSSSSVGESYFRMEYDYPSPNNMIGYDGILVNVRADLPEYGTFRIEFTNGVSVAREYRLQDYLTPFQNGNIYVDLRTFTSDPQFFRGITRIMYEIIPAENNIDLRMSFSDGTGNYLSFKQLNVTDVSAYRANDNNQETYFKSDAVTFEISFEPYRFRSVTFRWNVAPSRFTVYYNDNGVNKKIQMFENNRKMNLIRNKLPKQVISNFIVEIDSYSELVEIEGF